MSSDQEPAAGKKKSKSKKPKAGNQHELPWEVAFTQRMGRHAVAKHKLEPGELLLLERAVACVPIRGKERDVCHQCFRDVESSSAVLPHKRYCTSACQTADRLGSTTCPVHNALTRLEGCACEKSLLRLILELDAHRALPSTTASAGPPACGAAEDSGAAEASGAAAAGCTAGGAQAGAGVGASGVSERKGEGGRESAAVWQADVRELQCSLADVEVLSHFWDQQPQQWREEVTKGIKQLCTLIQQGGTYTPGSLQQMQHLAGQITTNAHPGGNRFEENNHCAVGMWPALSCFNHSCSPNVWHWAEGPVQHVHVVHTVQPGEQLFVHYVSLHEPRLVRQMQLLREKHFTCGCQRCLVPLAESPDRFLEGVECPNATCNGVLIRRQNEPGGEVLDFTCAQCKRVVPPKNRQGTGPLDLEQQAHAMLQQGRAAARQAGTAAARPVFEELLASFSGKGRLHPSHLVLHDSLLPLVNGCRRTSDIVGAIKYLTRLISQSEALYSEPNLETAALHELLGHLHAQRAQDAPSKLRARPKKQSQEAVAKAANMKRICGLTAT